jgi:hypothetical protein
MKNFPSSGWVENPKPWATAHTRLLFLKKEAKNYINIKVFASLFTKSDRVWAEPKGLGLLDTTFLCC